MAEATTAEDPNRAGSRGNVAGLLQTRYEYFGNPDDLDEAIDINRAALVAAPPGHHRVIPNAQPFSPVWGWP